MKTESQIEDGLIQKLQDLKYIYRKDIKEKLSLENNFREHFQTLNNVNLSESEFTRLKDEIITPDVFTASQILRERNTFQREDGTPLHYTLVNIKDWCKNEFEVVRQLRMNTEYSGHRYDVIILINGIPVVQIELKSLNVPIKKAMEQIVAYKKAQGNGYTNSLLCFIQLFIISNENNTHYFSNNQNKYFEFNSDEKYLPDYQLADELNKKINHLYDFSEKFLEKCTLGQMISKYMVLIASEKKLMVMRSYQIYAVKAIIDCIQQNRGNGYIWHTTGSGKTLTSFKASTLLKDNPNIEKCLFVVDRKDLDRQTREEFNKFQEGCVEENTNTEALVKRLLSDNYSDKVIVTTIQKLGIALSSNKDAKLNYKKRLDSLKKKRIVFIFDECHRSQFGENHKSIKEFFPNAQLFGFTGTPIFEQNANYKKVDGTESTYKTTKDIFEKQLHAYTITNAIDDKNVLRFKISYFKPKNNEVLSLDHHQRQKSVVEYILKEHDTMTDSRKFNAIFATSSINNAIQYYHLFEEIQNEYKNNNKEYRSLNIVCVFSPPAEGNKDVKQIQEDLPQEKIDNNQEPDKKKKELNKIIEDYNKKYNTNHSFYEFDSYYQDIQQRIKDQQYNNKDFPHEKKIDLIIVVDMLLTGFDSKYLNTLYVDKNLKYHSLIQAFSRTNRVLNVTKPHGNIYDFRQQRNEVEEAITLFSGEDNNQAKEIWLVEPATKVIKQFREKVDNFKKFMDSKDLTCEPSEVNNLKGESARIEFINNFKEVLRIKTQLSQYSDITEEEASEIQSIIPEEKITGFRRTYLELAQKLIDDNKKNKNESNSETDDVDFEFILFASAIIDYDYIISLLSKSTEQDPSKHKKTREQIISLLSSHSNLTEEKEDMIDYINTFKTGIRLTEKEIREGYQKFKVDKSNRDLDNLAKKYNLDTTSFRSFVDNIIERFIFEADTLTDLILPLGLPFLDKVEIEKKLMQDLIPLLKKLANGREITGLSAYE